MGSLVKGIFGMDAGEKAGQAGVEAGERYAKDVYFKPVTITSLLGSMSGDEKGQYSSAVSPTLLGLTAQQLGGAEKFYETLSDFDVGSVANELYNQQLDMLRPELAAQQIQMQEQMFGTGRLGLKLAGEGLGVGTSGAVSPDAYGLGLAQSRMLGELATGARQQAFGEAQQYGQLASGLLGSAMGIEQMTQQLIAQGINAQSARSAASAAAGQIGTGGYNMATQAAMNADNAMGSFWGGLFAGAGSAYGGAKLAAAGGSDIVFKENIEPIGILPSGFTWYKWNWKPEYFEWIKKTGRSVAPAEGVLAQEVQHSMPDAVKEDNGYLTVDYSKILEA
jgi:hypothetical protein